MVLRIFKMVATSGFLTALECTKFVFGRGSAPDPTGGAYSATPDPLAGSRGPASKWRGRGGKGKEGRGREGEGRDPLSQIPGSAPDFIHETRYTV